MTTPQSLLNANFTSLGSFSYFNTLNDDYCHKKLGTFKLKGSTSKKSSFNLKGNLNLKGDKLNISEEVKFTFPYERFFLQTKATRNGDFEFHTDFGDVEIFKKLNLFSTYRTNDKFGYHDFSIGANYFGPKCESNLRVDKTKGNTEIQNRTICTHKDVKYGFVSTFSLTDQKFNKYDGFVEFKCKDLLIHLEHLSLQSNGFTLGKGIMGLLYKVKPSTTLAFQLKNNFAKPKTRAVFGVQHQYNSNVTLRGKVDQKGKLTGAGKFKVRGIGVTLGAQLNLQNGANCIDVSKTLPLPMGFTLDYEA